MARCRIAMRIRRLRLRARFTQEQLARRVGVTTHTIWRLENSSNISARLSTLRGLARALQVDISELLA